MRNTHSGIRLFAILPTGKTFIFMKCGNAKLAIGRVRITSEITWEAAVHDFRSPVFRRAQSLGGRSDYLRMRKSTGLMSQEVTESFYAGDLPDTIRRMDRYFGASTYSLRSLFRDELRRVLNQILETSMENTRSTFPRDLQSLCHFYAFPDRLGYPFAGTSPLYAEFVLNHNLKLEFQRPEMSPEWHQEIIRGCPDLAYRTRLRRSGIYLEEKH